MRPLMCFLQTGRKKKKAQKKTKTNKEKRSLALGYTWDATDILKIDTEVVGGRTQERGKGGKQGRKQER